MFSTQTEAMFGRFLCLVRHGNLLNLKTTLTLNLGSPKVYPPSKAMFNESPNIPPELYRFIVLHLHQDLPSLLAVSLVSQTLNVEGQRVLYKNVDILHKPDAETLFLTTIVSQKRLALLVEEYHEPGDILRYRNDSLWGLICRGVQAMVNLKRLFLSFEGGSCPRPSLDRLYPHLQSLEVLELVGLKDLEVH
jgi:hypothetical protein